jgi:flagellar hook assembly protein FlgD
MDLMNRNSGFSTSIGYSIPQETSVKLDIFNIKGQHVKSIIDEYQEAGSYSANWNGEDENQQQVKPGIYFYRLRTKNSVKIRKMILLK